MALAIDASTPALVSGTGTTAVTASFTPPSNSLLVAMVGCNDSSTADTSVTITNSGTALTWTRRARKNENASSTGGVGTNGGVEIFTAPMVTGAALTVTATNALSGTAEAKAMQVVVLTGADTASLSNVNAATSGSGLPSVALAGCTAGSYVFAAASDWAQKGAGTAGTGQTIPSGWEYDQAGQITIHFWRTTTTLAASGSQTMNLTAVAAQQYNLCVLEVLAAGGAAAPIINLTMAPITGY